MIGKIYRRKKGNAEPDFLGRIVFDEGNIASFATLNIFSDFLFGKVTDGVEYFISVDGTDSTSLWKILEVMELPLSNGKQHSGIYKHRLTMDKLPG
jgi:hypothetical protein